MSEVIEWKTPPPSRRGRQAGEIDPIADALRERPGQWALVFTESHAGRSGSLKKRLQRRGNWFEVTSRKSDAATYDVYARWNCPGDNGAAAPEFWTVER